MGELLNIITSLHQKTERNYIGRMQNGKTACSRVAREYGKDFWDGSRKYGYGGYKYDGRWRTVAELLVEQYRLKENARILDVGCGKGFLLYELKKLLPEAEIAGFDISAYAISNAKEEIRSRLFIHRAQDPYPYKDNEFDLVLSLTTLFNLAIFDFKKAVREIDRVGKAQYITLESYRNVEELFNLQCWALTCEQFLTPDEWVWLFSEFGYHGDYEFVYFE